MGRALQPFPRSKRSRHVSAHSAFQLGLSTREGRKSPLPTERCTSRKGPSSVFLSGSVHFFFDRLTLTDLHHVLAITARRWATTPPPSSSPYAGMFASHCGGGQGVGGRTF